MRTPCKLRAFLLCISLVLPAGSAIAQDYTRPTEGVVLPSPSITEANDATALSINPTNISLLDSWSFVYSGSWLQSQQNLAGQGHGFFLASPLGPLGIGISVEALTPPDSVTQWQNMDNRVRFSLGLAYQFQRVFALGLAYRTFFAYEAGEIHTLDLGLTVQPVNYLSMSFVASDVTAPIYRDETDQTESQRAPRRFNVGITARPLGNDRLAIGGELLYLSGDDYNRTDITGILTGMIINGLTLRGRFGAQGVGGETNDEGYFLDASLGIELGHFGIVGSSYGQVHPGDLAGYQGTVISAHLSGDAAPSLAMSKIGRATNAVFIPIEKRLSIRELDGLVEILNRIERDRSVDMVVFSPVADAMSLSASFEIRRRIVALKSAGVKTVCLLTEAKGPTYLGCAGADHVWINPVGGIRMAGLSMRSIYFGDLLKKLGVQADIIRIGKYKSAPESYTRSGPTEPASMQTNAYLDSVYERTLAILVKDRGFENIEAAKKIMENGPYTASEALEAGLVDKKVFLDEFEKDLTAQLDRPIKLNKNYINENWRRRSYVDSPSVAVVYIDGDIIEGKNIEIPFIGIRMTGSKTITEVLRKLGADARIRSVVLRINSPGGSAVASELIWREVMALRKSKHVIASLGAVAASGGYYIASAAHEIYTEPVTITGSIGIFYGKADLSGLLEKIGVNIKTYKRGIHADAQSWTRPYTPEERIRMMRQIQEFYDIFKDRVVEGRGRGFTPEIVDKLGRGRIWSGADSVYHLLTDSLGGYAEALDRARKLGRIKAETRVFHYPRPDSNILIRLLSSLTAKARGAQSKGINALISSLGLKKLVGAVYPFAAVDEGTPRARLPFIILDK